MKHFKFEIILTDEDLIGDEFWEDAIKRDGTGITVLTETIIQAIEDSNLLINSEKSVCDILKLVNYNES